MTTRTASNETEIEAALALSVPGDIVECTDGTYTDMTINTATVANGTAGNPVTLKAVNKHQAVLDGNSSIIAVRSDYFVVDGFKFDQIAADPVARLDGCVYSQFINCYFDRCGLSGSNSNIRIETTGSDNNRVTSCVFDTPAAQGIAIFVTAANLCKDNTIEYCTFKDANLADSPSIQIGQVAASYSINSNNSVIGCLFDNQFTGSELISNKSAYNTYKNNIFRDCTSPLSLRRGTNCNVLANTWDNGSGHMRVFGADHIIVGNEFYGSSGVAIKLDAATSADGDGDPYPQSLNCEIAGNTIVNCATGIRVNDEYAVTTREVLPSNNISANIIVLNTNNVNVADETDQNTYTSNMISPREPGFTDLSTRNFHLRQFVRAEKWWPDGEARYDRDGLQYQVPPNAGAYDLRTGGAPSRRMRRKLVLGPAKFVIAEPEMDEDEADEIDAMLAELEILITDVPDTDRKYRVKLPKY